MTIKELRFEKGLTRAAFAESIGIDLSTLESYESGERNPSATTLAAIKDIYGVELSIPGLTEEAGQKAAEAAEVAVDEKATAEAPVEETTAEAEAVGEAVAEKATKETAGDAKLEEAVEEAAAEAEAIEGSQTEEAAEQAPSEEEALDTDIEEAAAEEAVEEFVEKAVEEAIEEANAEEAAALIAVAEKAARKAAKKARKAEQLAALQKADEEATRLVIDIITALSDNVNLDDRDAVAAARDAYDSLTDDQELMIPGDVLRLLFSAEQKIEDAEEAAARKAATIPIGECQITVKDVVYTGKKIKKPSVKVVCGETALEPGEDYSLKYDKKARDIGLYMLTVKGKGRFTGSAKAPFYVVPKASEYVSLLGDDKQADKAWKLLKNIEGYQIEYSLNKDLSDSRKAKIRKPKDLSKVLRKLKAGKKYYLRVRLFATVKKKRRHSDWSKVKAVKL